MEITEKLSNNEQRDKELKEKISVIYDDIQDLPFPDVYDMECIFYMIQDMEECIEKNKYYWMSNEDLFRKEFQFWIGKLYPQAFVLFDGNEQYVCITRNQLINLYNSYMCEEEKLTNRLNQISKCQASISNLMAVWPEET